MLSSARAGFPSPADDHVEKQLDLNDYLIGDKAATCDLLIVDRSVEATDGRVVIAVVKGSFTVKRLRKKAGQCCWRRATRSLPPSQSLTRTP
jgi:DNA polymerase V